MKATVRKGFTLIEILIVVIILGILAAIVIPQFTNASEDAKNSSVASQLQTIRGSVELYKLQHGGLYPTAAGDVATGIDWTKMTSKTLETGVVDAAGTFGPYLQQTPINSLNNQSACGANAVFTGGWVLQTDGRIMAVNKGKTAALAY